MRPCCRGRRLRAVSQAQVYRVRSYPFMFIENLVGEMASSIANAMTAPCLPGSWARWQSSPPMVIGESGRCYDVSQRPNDCPSSTPSGYIASCAIMACCWKENRRFPGSSRHIRGVSPLTRAIDAGARMALSFAAIMAKTPVTFAMDCCDRKP